MPSPERDPMTRRWTPKRFVTLRRFRICACVASLTLASTLAFGVSARKTVALIVDGETTTVTTYAMSVDRLLQEQGVKVKTHDLVESSTPTSMLKNHDVVTVKSAYQTTITIDGQEVLFWTIATSADQLLGFFEQNETEAATARVTVSIDNVYNKLTGGLVINQSGPVTVIADGQSSQAPNGKLPAASILDSKGITLNKEDRVSVEKDGDETILRVRRVTHGEETRSEEVAFDTQTIVDTNLQPGEVVVRQEGENGEIQKTYDVTYVDGEKESESLTNETTTKIAIDRVIAIGPAQTSNDTDSDSSSNKTDKESNSGDDNSQSNQSNQSDKNDASNGNTSGGTDNNNTGNDSNGGNTDNGNSDTGKTDNNDNNNSNNTSNDNSNNNSGDNSNNKNDDNNNSNNSGSTTPSDPSAGCRLYHPTPAQAQTYAAGAAAQYGWTGQNWTDLVKLWTRESSWMWNAENPSSGAYGIPQSLPGSKMATFGERWRDDAAVQIDWGLNYIKQSYGSPSKAWQHSEEIGWY